MQECKPTVRKESVDEHRLYNQRIENTETMWKIFKCLKWAKRTIWLKTGQ